MGGGRGRGGVEVVRVGSAGGDVRGAEAGRLSRDSRAKGGPRDRGEGRPECLCLCLCLCDGARSETMEDDGGVMVQRGERGRSGRGRSGRRRGGGGRGRRGGGGEKVGCWSISRRGKAQDRAAEGSSRQRCRQPNYGFTVYRSGA